MHYVPISRYEPRVEVFSRDDHGWHYRAIAGLDDKLRVRHTDDDIELSALMSGPGSTNRRKRRKRRNNGYGP